MVINYEGLRLTPRPPTRPAEIQLVGILTAYYPDGAVETLMFYRPIRRMPCDRITAWEGHVDVRVSPPRRPDGPLHAW